MISSKVTLRRALRDWETETFAATLKAQLEGLGTECLPLSEATAQGGLVDDRDISVMVLRSHEERHRICAQVGVFFSEIVGGCSCGDDPFVQTAYCELEVYIDKLTAEAGFAFVSN